MKSLIRQPGTIPNLGQLTILIGLSTLFNPIDLFIRSIPLYGSLERTSQFHLDLTRHYKRTSLSCG